jgi:hypothetical protein
MYAVGGVMIRVFTLLRPVVGGMAKVLDLELHPIRSIGWIVMVLISILWWMSVVLKLLF